MKFFYDVLNYIEIIIASSLQPPVCHDTWRGHQTEIPPKISLFLMTSEADLALSALNKFDDMK